MGEILKVNDLKVQFQTRDGLVHAVNGVSINLDEGETLGIVGESGCGKSVTMMSLLRIVPSPPGILAGGTAMARDKDTLVVVQEAEPVIYDVVLAEHASLG